MQLAMSHFFTLHRCNQTDMRAESYRPIFRRFWLQRLHVELH
jgi:hypothetical protein